MIQNKITRESESAKLNRLCCIGEIDVEKVR